MTAGAHNECDHLYTDVRTWYGGPGGPLQQITCLTCKRSLREEIDGEGFAWPKEDR